eukprot:s3346_g3.t1
MERIRSTEPHFVRCIKPNQKNVAGSFERKSVVQQLQYQGVLQAIEVSRVGFPVRLKHRQAVKEFICLSPERVQVESQVARGHLASAARLLFERLSEPLSPTLSPSSPRTPRTPRTPRRSICVIPKQTWAVGKSLVFLKREAVEALSHALSGVRRAAAVQIQACVRSHQAWKRFHSILQAVRRVQTNARGFVARKRVAAMRKLRAVLRLQSWQRGRHCREEAKLRSWALGFIQAWSRARRLRKILLQKRAAVPRLQSFWRLKLSALRWKRRSESAMTIQRVWRGHRGVQEAKRQKVEEFKRHRSARLILKQWRNCVSYRVLEKDLDEFLGQAETINLKIQSRLQGASDGELQAMVESLRAKSRQRQHQLLKLQAEEQVLKREVVDLSGWTFLGILKKLAVQIVERICPRQHPRGPQRPQSASAPRPHWERDIPREPSTTEVPDFAARHERIKRQLERRKYMNRGVTQPEPFVFNTPTRSQSRHPSMPKDPRRDWRYHRPTTPGPTAPVAPVRSTEKVTSYQQATMKKLQERRVKEMKEREELKEAQAPNQEVKFRVMQAMGKVEPLEQKIERIVSDKRRGLQRTQREKEEEQREMGRSQNWDI